MAWNKKKDVLALMCGHGKSIDGSWDPGCTYGKDTEAGGDWTGDTAGDLSGRGRKFGYIDPNYGVKTVTNTGSGGAHTHSGTTNGAGGNGKHNNMPPYLTVYMWKRTA